MRELILRAVLAASERAAPDRLLLSLAGGRKTMSADLQRAGTLFGCRAMLHVIDVARLPEALFKPDPARLAAPLAGDEIAALLPLIVGRGQRAEHLDVDDGAGRVTAARFPLPEPPPFVVADDAQLWPYQPGLAEELDRREREGQRLLGNFFGQLAREEHHENWRGLYRLPPRRIDELRQTRLDAGHRPLLVALPKAELHCHIGGILDLPAQRQVAAAVWDALAAAERARARAELARIPWTDPAAWPAALRASAQRTALAVAALIEFDDARLNGILYAPPNPGWPCAFAIRWVSPPTNCPANSVVRRCSLIRRRCNPAPAPSWPGRAPMACGCWNCAAVRTNTGLPIRWAGWPTFRPP